MNPLISVIVPVWNSEKYIRECVESICAQTYKNLEIILVDDGSTDGTPRICDEISREDPRITVIHKENGGPSSARNAGLDAAKGDFISFLDSDDVMLPEMLGALLNRMETADADISICGYSYADAKLSCADNYSESMLFSCEIEDAVLTEDEFWDKLANHSSMVCTTVWNKLYKAAIFKELRFTEGIYFEDVKILPDIVSRCKRIACISDKYVIYRQHPASILHEGFNIKKFDIVKADINTINYLASTKRWSAAENITSFTLLTYSTLRTCVDRKDKDTMKYCKELRRELIKTTAAVKPHLSNPLSKIHLFFFERFDDSYAFFFGIAGKLSGYQKNAELIIFPKT